VTTVDGSEQQNPGLDLRSLGRVLRAHWTGILVITLLGLAAAGGWVLTQPRVYEADSSAYVRAVVDNTDASSELLGNNLVQARIASYADIGSWRSVAERVIDELGLDTSAEALVRRVSVSNGSDTSVLRVTASAEDPYLARDLAEAWVRSMIFEINAVETGNGDTPGVVNVIPGDSARVPATPSSPDTKLALAVGLVMGLAIGVVYALLRHILDRRVRSAEQVERETGVAVVGMIPAIKDFTAENRLIPTDDSDPRQQSDDMHAMGEALRTMRSNLQFMDVDNPPRAIVVTSPLPGDGKSTTSANLALTLAAAGERVILIDGDLRRPMVTKVFHLIEGSGLTDVLAGRAIVDDVAHRVNENLIVIGPGQIPPNPSELLGSERMHTLLKSLAEQAFVIIDAPPLIPVTDAAILARRVDGALVVTKAGTTTSEVLLKALHNLKQVNARALGVVLNRVPLRGPGAVYYGYQYRGKYYRGENSDAGSGRRKRSKNTASTSSAEMAPHAGRVSFRPLDDTRSADQRDAPRAASRRGASAEG
jgi:capsular exopolysaccharide synthesis family protein